MARVQPELVEKMRSEGRVSCREAAKLAFVSDVTIRTWIYDEEIDAVFYAHAWWVDLKSLRKRAKPERIG